MKLKKITSPVYVVVNNCQEFARMVNMCNQTGVELAKDTIYTECSGVVVFEIYKNTMSPAECKILPRIFSVSAFFQDYVTDGPDLEKLDHMLNDALDNETKESLTEFMETCEKKDNEPEPEEHWTPKYGEEFWYVGGGDFSTFCIKMDNRSINKNRVRSGNCFKTRLECKELTKKIRKVVEKHQNDVKACRELYEGFKGLKDTMTDGVKTCFTDTDAVNVASIMSGHQGEKFFSTAYGDLTFCTVRKDSKIVMLDEENEEVIFHPSGKLRLTGMIDLWPSRSYYELYPNDPTGAWLRYDEVQNIKKYGDIVRKLYVDEHDSEIMNPLNTIPAAQMRKLIAVNMLMNIKRVIDPTFIPDWEDENQKKYVITHDHSVPCFGYKEVKDHTSDIVFSSPEIVEQATNLMGCELKNLFN